ncbi:MAG: selenide, water dikinase SelD [Calditrichaeota bacterium]|nr:selenide, water dikinase SelD [Calditrichota bacterium]
MGPAELDRILQQLPEQNDPSLLVGLASHDDAGVYRLSDEQVLIQTVDFFTPVVDNPRDFGRIAVANALSDIYAMGGRPITALNIVGFPAERVDLNVLGEILVGGMEKLAEAGVALLGGHSVKDPELKFGVAVTGLAHPDEVVTNAGARPGDGILLTKPLGSGILTTALKNNRLSSKQLEAVTRVMAQLNDRASQIMKRYQVHACTDVTGFGLLGHLLEVVRASEVSARLWMDRIPLLEGALELAAQGHLPGGLQANRQYAEPHARISEALSPEQKALLYDPQTSGGLLICVPRPHVRTCLQELKAVYPQSALIGEIRPPAEVAIEVVPRSETPRGI